MADSAFDESEAKKNSSPADKIGDMFFGSALDFVRRVEQRFAELGPESPQPGELTAEEKALFKAEWKKMGPLDTILVQQKLGSKLNWAIN